MSAQQGPDGTDRVIIYGELDLPCLLDDTPLGDGIEQIGPLWVPPYQRELLLGEKHHEIKRALRTIGVQPVLYGLRGSDVDETEPGTFVVRGTVAIIDGQQRTYAARELLRENRQHQQNGRPEKVARFRLGVALYVSSTEAQELELFEQFNFKQTPVKTTLLLRNRIYTAGSTSKFSPAVTAISRLVDDTPDFLLHQKVQWSQRSLPSEIISARTVAITLAHLYGYRSNEVEPVVARLDEVIDEIGSDMFIANIRTFFETIEEAWPFNGHGKGRRRVRSQLKGDFLCAVATLFAEYADFWEGYSLTISSKNGNKLAGFALDESVVTILKRPGSAKTLTTLLVDHINKKRKVDTLTKRSEPWPWNRR